jgi:hypothetical protein
MKPRDESLDPAYLAVKAGWHCNETLPSSSRQLVEHKEKGSRLLASPFPFALSFECY